jgi:hypothetical protein
MPKLSEWSDKIGAIVILTPFLQMANHGKILDQEKGKLFRHCQPWLAHRTSTLCNKCFIMAIIKVHSA